MRALVQDSYGPLESVLRVEEVEDPQPGPGEVLLAVRAASIHIGDVFGMLGVPYLLRPSYGLRRPKTRIPGTDVAGIIKRVGPGVSDFEPGTEVFGWCGSGFAEYAVVPHDQLLPKPASLDFAGASAVGVSATTALLAVRDHGHVASGDRVLVTGASGGVGSFAVQIARDSGAHVTAVCGPRNVELMRSLGADEVIDYTSQDLLAVDERFDFILDGVGNHPMRAMRRLLTEGGRLLSNGAPTGGWHRPLVHFLLAGLASTFDRRQLRPFDATPSLAALRDLVGLIDSGAVSPVIDRTYSLDDAAAAIAHVAERHSRGTTVIEM